MSASELPSNVIVKGVNRGILDFKTTVQIDKTAYKSKPENEGKVTNMLKKREAVTEVSVEQLAAFIACGASFMVSVCPGRNKKTWQSCSGFCVDIDNDSDQRDRGYDPLSSKDALKRAEAHDLHPVIAYQTFSSTREQEKYRLLFLFAEQITDRAQFDRIAAKLLDLYPDADDQTVEGERFFYGTNKKVIVLPDAEILPPDEFEAHLANVERMPPPHAPKKNGKKGASAPFEVPDEIPEGKRHKTLHAMASSMRAKRFSYEATLAAVEAENAARCNPRYDDAEVESIVDDVFGRYKAGMSTEQDEDVSREPRSGSPPKHMALVSALLDRGFVIVNDMPAIPGAEGFEFGWQAVQRAMLDVDPWSRDCVRKEALKTLKFIGREVPAANPRFIGFTNGVLDVLSYKLYTNAEFASMGLGIVPATIPHAWNPRAQECEAVETLLDGVACHDLEVRSNLEEVAGLCMSRYADNRSRAAWMYGIGENGKSTVIDALEYLVGKPNSCALMLDDFKGQFNTQMLVGKLLVISDDQPSGALDKGVIGVIKKIVTGQPIKIEPKGIDPYNATMFCTIIATSNEPPQLGDTTHGSMRRWHLIPLNANFGEAGSGRDVNLRDKLRTEEAAQWLACLGVVGLRRVIAQEGMTETSYSRSAIQEARERSNSVIAFIAEHTRDEFLAEPNVELWYWRYAADAKNKGDRPFTQAKFSQMVSTEFGFATANNGRYRAGDPELTVGGLAREHGRSPGDKFRIFVDKDSRDKRGANAGH